MILWQSIVNGFIGFLQFFYGLTLNIGIPSYGLAIILLTIFLKLILHPLNNKQMISMRRMQELQPKLKEIQEKYKNKPEKAQKATMELYQKHKINPMAGCLPILIQMPILIALYQALLNFPYQVEEHARFFWLASLSQPDNQLFILPILAGLTTFLQQSVMMANRQDSSQRIMLYTMPLFIAWLATTFPAGLALYWVVLNTIGTLQQILINRRPLDLKGEEK